MREAFGGWLKETKFDLATGPGTSREVYWLMYRGKAWSKCWLKTLGTASQALRKSPLFKLSYLVT